MQNASLHFFISQLERNIYTLEQSCELTWGSNGINQIMWWRSWKRGEVQILKLKLFFFLSWGDVLCTFPCVPALPVPVLGQLFVAAVKQVLPETKGSLTNSSTHTASFYIGKISVQFSTWRQAHRVVGPFLAFSILAGEGWWPLSKAGVRGEKLGSTEVYCRGWRK